MPLAVGPGGGPLRHHAVHGALLFVALHGLADVSLAGLALANLLGRTRFLAFREVVGNRGVKAGVFGGSLAASRKNTDVMILRVILAFMQAHLFQCLCFTRRQTSNTALWITYEEPQEVCLCEGALFWTAARGTKRAKPVDCPFYQVWLQSFNGAFEPQSSR